MNVWHADCEQNIYSKVSNRLWIKLCFSVIFDNMEIKIRISLEILTKFNTKILCTFCLVSKILENILAFKKILKRGMQLTIITIITYLAWNSCFSRDAFGSLKIWLWICSIHNTLEVLNDHLLTKSQSAVVSSFRKLGHKITISQFGTTVA